MSLRQLKEKLFGLSFSRLIPTRLACWTSDKKRAPRRPLIYYVKKMINRYFTVLGIDPSISHFGLVYGFFDADTREFFPLLTKTIANDVNPTDYPHLNATGLKAYKAWRMSRLLHGFINQEHSCDGLTGKIRSIPIL